MNVEVFVNLHRDERNKNYLALRINKDRDSVQKIHLSFPSGAQQRLKIGPVAILYTKSYPGKIKCNR